MPIEITERHMHSSEDLKEYAGSRASALLEEFPGVEHIHVILDIEKHRQIAEVVVQGKHHVRTESKESSDNMRASLDMAIDKVEKQLRKLTEKMVDHKPAMKRVESERTKGVVE